MSLLILEPGVQSTIQSGPRQGYRHWGVPWSGPADLLSFALANRCVGNAIDAAGLEITYGQLRVRFTRPALFSLVGAPASALLNNVPVIYGEPYHAPADSVLSLGAVERGVRTYLALAGGITAESFMQSDSTYLPAKLGGLQGRALTAGDQLVCADVDVPFDKTRIGAQYHVDLTGHWRLRLHKDPQLVPYTLSHKQFFDTTFIAGRRADRMGLQLEGRSIDHVNSGTMESVAVFPGTVQCPPDGHPFILMADAQTTGGYPRLGQIARVDRHKLGQIRPGDGVQFLQVSADAAYRALLAKTKDLQPVGVSHVFS